MICCVFLNLFHVLQIDLLEARNLTGVVTKGFAEGNDIESMVPESWVETYKVEYSVDNIVWNPIIGSSGEEKVK